MQWVITLYNDIDAEGSVAHTTYNQRKVVKMKKFMILSGFLGAGKTTAMIALSRHFEREGIRTHIIANDLGASDNVDAKFTALEGCCVMELGGDCICYQTENLVDKLRRAFDYEGAQLVMSDIPGCSVGGLEHVYFKLDREYPGEFELAPMAAMTDPIRLRGLVPGASPLRLPEEVLFLFRAQMREADALVLNKIDLLDPEERERYLRFLSENFPGKPLFAISARTGEGIGKLAEYLRDSAAPLEWRDAGGNSDAYAAAEEQLSWYNRQFYIWRETPFDGNAFCLALMGAISEELTHAGANVPHLKLFAQSEDSGACKLSLLGVEYEIERDRMLAGRCAGLSVLINARAACHSQALAAIMDHALHDQLQRWDVECKVYFTESFGMMDEGRI